MIIEHCFLSVGLVVKFVMIPNLSAEHFSKSICAYNSFVLVAAAVAAVEHIIHCRRCRCRHRPTRKYE